MIPQKLKYSSTPIAVQFTDEMLFNEEFSYGKI